MDSKPTQVCPACGEIATYTCIPDSLGVLCEACGVISVCGKPTQWTLCKWAEDLAERASAKKEGATVSDLEQAIDRLRKWAQVKGRRAVLEFGRHSDPPHNPFFYLELNDYQTEQFSGTGNGGGEESLTQVINRAVDWKEQQ